MDITIKIYQKKSKELKSMLLEEKVYEEQSKGLILNDHEWDAGNTSRRKKSSGWRKQKVKLYQKKNNFGFLRLLFVFSLAISLIISMQFVYYVILSPKGNKITNIVKVYILAVELWSAYASIHTFAFETILWNNTLPIWNTDSLSAYKIMKKHIKMNIIPNFTEALEYDMGNYTDIYINQISKVNFLKNQKKIKIHIFFSNFKIFSREIHVKLFGELRPIYTRNAMNITMACLIQIS